ncbi:MAG: ImmA/IrrE family metallo-endopeptidase [Proteobacteria bacterium]|nr:MAG: ImmA/IrrE family metallo-endopeptidase [Pseudomonadota bacterium]
MTAQTRMRALKTWDFAALIRDYLDNEFNLPELSVPDYSADLLDLKDSSESFNSLNFAELAAENLRDEWRLGDGPIPNMVHLMESKGISIFWTNIESHTVDACCHWANDQPIVLLNSNVESGERARFNAAHELGHLVLHREELRKNLVIESSSEEIDDDFEPKPREESTVEEKASAAKRRELEAHRFASAFLLPFRSWSQETPIHSEPNEFLRMKRRWKTSVQAMIRRSFDLGILSEFQYESAMKQVSIRGWRKLEPDSLPLEQSQVHKEILELLRNRGESPLDLAFDLHLQASVLETLMPVSREFKTNISKPVTRSTINPVLPFPSREEF